MALFLCDVVSKGGLCGRCSVDTSLVAPAATIDGILGLGSWHSWDSFVTRYQQFAAVLMSLALSLLMVLSCFAPNDRC